MKGSEGMVKATNGKREGNKGNYGKGNNGKRVCCLQMSQVYNASDNVFLYGDN